jgi:cupin 2 domain-containing protein
MFHDGRDIRDVGFDRIRRDKKRRLGELISTSNLFQQIPSDLSEEVFETLAAKGDVKIERIISRGHASPKTGWYDQDKDEWVAVLTGFATIAFENGSVVDLQAGDYLHIPAHTKHRVTSTSSEPPTLWLAAHY